MAAGARVFEYTNLNPSIPVTGGDKIPFHSLMGDIKFKNVTFSYPSRPDHKVLRQFR